MFNYILLFGLLIVSMSCLKLIKEVKRLRYYSRRTNNKIRFLEQKISGGIKYDR